MTKDNCEQIEPDIKFKKSLKSTNKCKLQMSSYTISVNSQCKHMLKWLSWRRHWENSIQLTSVSVSTKGEK